jgi:hypothetical protein
MNKKNFDSKKHWNKPKKTFDKSASRANKVFSCDPEKITKIFAQKPKPEHPSFLQKTSFSFENFKSKFYHKDWFKQINYELISFGLVKKLNYLAIFLTCFSLILFFVYLAFFDEKFVIRSYKISFAENSYLNQYQTRKLVNQFHNQKLYGFLPNNQYWFLNNLSLTNTARQTFPEIEKVALTNRVWPNSAEVKVEMSKIALTLAVKENNEQKFWRLSPNGSVLSEDKAGIWENLVTVEKPYAIVGQESKNPKEPTSLQNFSFSTEPDQVKRIELTQFLWKVFRENNIKIASTVYPSIGDTDIVFKTDAGTNLYFDSNAFGLEMQRKRLEGFYNSKVGESLISRQEQDGKLSYIDFRIPKRIFFCNIGTKCVRAES